MAYISRHWFGLGACGALVVLGAAWNSWAVASDVKLRKDNPHFNVDVDEDGLKTFTVIGKKVGMENQLLPAAPQGMPKSLATTDLAQVPEVGLEEPLNKSGAKQDVMEEMEFRFARVNFFNLKKTDGFLQALLNQRPDLAGLPFKMGADCRLCEEKALALGTAIGQVRSGGDKAIAGSRDLGANPDFDQPMVAALMQIHGPKEKQEELARVLSTIPHVDATRALARLALYSPDAKAREIAARGLKVRREQDYTPMLLDGLRYPLPAAARRAAEALVRLDRKDLVPQLVATLEAPDPRLPVQQKTGWQARELVRLNHHRNCLLCHPPAHTKATLHLPTGEKSSVLRDRADRAKKAMEKLQGDADNLLAPAPLPNRSFQQGSDAYRREGDMDHILVRVDVTYLRQDFSAMLPVADAAPWPDFQRFDFLVRTRVMTEAEANMLRQTVAAKTSGVSPYQQAALYGLRELTGLEATSAAEWRRLLEMPASPTK